MENQDSFNSFVNLVETDDIFADRVGARLAEILRLSPRDGDTTLWNTAWGGKSNQGLSRTVFAVLEGLLLDYNKTK